MRVYADDGVIQDKEPREVQANEGHPYINYARMEPEVLPSSLEGSSSGSGRPAGANNKRHERAQATTLLNAQRARMVDGVLRQAAATGDAHLGSMVVKTADATKEDALPANKSPASQSDFAALKSVKSCAGMVQSVVVSSAAHLDLAALSVKSEIVVPVG